MEFDVFCIGIVQIVIITFIIYAAVLDHKL